MALDWIEDPIFRRVQDRERRALKKACEFDSSQESLEVNESQNSTSMTGHNSITNHSSLGDAKCQPFMADQQEDCFEHCLDERVNNTQQREVEDDRPLLSCSQSSQVSTNTYTCTSATNQGNSYSQESVVKDCDIIQTQTNFKSSLSMTECAVQTINTITRESSAQWSPGDVPSLRNTVATSTEMPSARNNQLSSEVATQTDASISSGFCETHDVDGDRKNNVVLVDKDVQETKSTRDVEKMKEEIGRLKRQLGVTQSTLIWQSLMTRLHQL